MDLQDIIMLWEVYIDGKASPQKPSHLTFQGQFEAEINARLRF